MMSYPPPSSRRRIGARAGGERHNGENGRKLEATVGRQMRKLEVDLLLRDVGCWLPTGIEPDLRSGLERLHQLRRELSIVRAQWAALGGLAAAVQITACMVLAVALHARPRVDAVPAVVVPALATLVLVEVWQRARARFPVGADLCGITLFVIAVVPRAPFAVLPHFAVTLPMPHAPPWWPVGAELPQTAAVATSSVAALAVLGRLAEPVTGIWIARKLGPEGIAALIIRSVCVRPTDAGGSPGRRGRRPAFRLQPGYDDLQVAWVAMRWFPADALPAHRHRPFVAVQIHRAAYAVSDCMDSTMCTAADPRRRACEVGGWLLAGKWRDPIPGVAGRWAVWRAYLARLGTIAVLVAAAVALYVDDLGLLWRIGLMILCVVMGSFLPRPTRRLFLRLLRRITDRDDPSQKAC